MNPLSHQRRRAAVAIAAGVVVSAGLAAPAATAAPAPLNYVAMGDSYSAGSGILPLSDATPLCTQSSLNSAHVIAAAKSFALTDVSCGGATTGDFAGKQFGVVAPQLNALSTSTDLVTMTIGGNDNNTFVSMIAACGSAGMATLGFGSPCKALYGDSFANSINNSTYPNLVAALKSVRAKAPNARVAIAGYPHVMPADNSSCFAVMPIASGDVAYVNSIEATLNSAVQRAAAETGVTYVDMSAPTVGHDACKPVGTRWVEPAIWGTNYVPVHPNAAGEKAYADQYIARLGL